MAECQETAKPKEREIPVFTVLKNNCILKNIFVLDNPPSIPSSLEFDLGSEIEEVLMVGRHPDCNIKLEHPSISRFHLRIHSKPSSRSLFVTDLSSVHGTWVSGRRIEPDIRIRVSEGDTLQLGASSRLYRLNWVPLSRAYDLDDQFVPPLDASDTVDEEKEVAIDHDVDGVSYGNNQGKGLYSDEEKDSSVQTMSPTAPPVPDDFYDDPFTSKYEVENYVSPQTHNRENEPSDSQQCQVDGSVTVTVKEETDSVSYGNNQEKGLFSDENIALSVQTMSPTALPFAEDLYDDPFYKYEVENNIPPESYNRDYELGSSQLSQVDASVTIEEETDGVTDQDGDCVSDVMEGLEWLFPVEKIAPSMPENSHHSFPEENEDNNCSPEIFNNEIKHENSTPQGHMSLSASQTASQGETTEYSEMNSEEISGLSIWSRRGKSKSVKIETSQSRGKCARTNMSSPVKSVPKDRQCASPDIDDKIFTSDKDNTSPNSYLARSLKCKFGETLKDESFSNSPISNVDQDEVFTPDKENVTPDSHRLRPMKSVGRSGAVKCLNSFRPSPLKMAESVNVYQDEVFTPDKENVTPDNRLLRSMKSIGRSGEAKCLNSYRPSPLKIANNENVHDDEVLVPKASQHQKVLQESKSKSKSASGGVKCLNSYRPSPLKIVNNENMYQEEELFTPDKENLTPDSRLLRSMKRVGRSPLKIAYNENVYNDEVQVPKASQHQKVLQESKSTFSVSGGHGNLKKQQPRADREPFRALPVIPTSDHKDHNADSRSCTSIKYPSPEGVNHSYKNTTKVSKRWIIVADTTCLLNRKSRNELQLMRGLRGTSMIIPRIVVRELDCMLRRASFFSRMTESSAALNWIEECLAETKWWIHVQSSAEEGVMVPPTPPAAASHWSSDNKSPFSVGSNPFSPYTLQEIVTPTPADQILESALLFRRTTDAQLVLLSDDVALKIKAMAEGVICETAKEFRKSLVNPFSSRFLYSDSSPVGPTWSCLDDTVLKENYYPSPAKKSSKSGEGAKGLKLILLHNSSFRQMII